MKFIPEQDWQQKIENIKRLAANFRPKDEARRYTPAALTPEARARVESVTRFERVRGRVIKQNWRERVETNV